MGLTDKSGSSFAVNGLNAIFRLLQLAFGTVVVGIYASVHQDGYWDMWVGVDKAMELPIAAGVLAMLTAIVFGILPFLVSYYYVAIAFLWDWIVFFVWCAAFGINHKKFGNADYVSVWRGAKAPHIDTLVAAQWLILGGMLAQLMSAIMGPVCLILDRKSLRGSRSAV